MTNPSYQAVCQGITDHAEAIKIEFDPAKVTYDELVGKYAYTNTMYASVLMKTCFSPEFFYRTHDPTTVNRQGGDAGTCMSPHH